MRVEYHCAICLEDYTEENIRVYNTCGHSLCFRCADKWKRNGTCTMCRERAQAIRPYLDIRLKPSGRNREFNGGEPSSGELLPALRERARKIREQANSEEKASKLAENGLEDLVNAMRKEGIEIQEDVLDSIDDLKNTFVRQCNTLREEVRRFRQERDAANETITNQRRQIAQHDATLARVRREKVEGLELSLREAEKHEEAALRQAEEAVGQIVQLRDENSQLEKKLATALADVNTFKGKITRFKARAESAKKEAEEHQSKVDFLEQELARTKITVREPVAKPVRRPVPESSIVRVMAGTGPSEDKVYLPEEEEEDGLVVLPEEEEEEVENEADVYYPSVKPWSSRPPQRTPSQGTGKPMFPSWSAPLRTTVPRKRSANTSVAIGPLKLLNGRIQGTYDTGPKKRVKYSG